MFSIKEIDIILGKINASITTYQGELESIRNDHNGPYDMFFESSHDKKKCLRQIREDIKAMKSIRLKLLQMKQR
jgi:hypothetical protein